MTDLILGVSEFVAILNQTLEYAYPNVVIEGELANFKVSKNRWVYFDLKDDQASVKFFGTIYQLPGPLEDGMKVAVRGVPRLHQQFGFSVTVQTITLVGEGSIKKASKLLEAKLAAEGLFEESRKRPLPYPPKRIGLVASAESAAYHDFIKVLKKRWGGVKIILIDVQVQGEIAPKQIEQAIEQFNQMANMPDVLVITRGGGSADDLQAFSTEQVTRAVASSRIPTLVAIGHEVDISLAELAADKRASTPSNAAELLVPDRRALKANLQNQREYLDQIASRNLSDARKNLVARHDGLNLGVEQLIDRFKSDFVLRAKLLSAYDPHAALARGYAIVHKGVELIRGGKNIAVGDELDVQLCDVHLTVDVKKVRI